MPSDTDTRCFRGYAQSEIFHFFHLSDSTQQNIPGLPNYCRLFKVKKLLDILEDRFDKEYIVGQQCNIDEAMIPFKGRLGFKQYMRDKPVKWGIKVWVFSDAKNRYVKKNQIYTGKDEGNVSGIGLCSRVVLNLLEGLSNSGLHLYTDNFYTSPTLFHHLYNRGINACGTARAGCKHFPQELATRATTSNRGHYDYRSNGELLATVWVDKRTIYFCQLYILLSVLMARTLLLSRGGKLMALRMMFLALLSFQITRPTCVVWIVEISSRHIIM